MKNPYWDGKVYKQQKAGEPFDWNTAKGAERKRQLARQRRKGVEQDRRWREQQEAEQPFQVRWPFRIIPIIFDFIFRG